MKMVNLGGRKFSGLIIITAAGIAVHVLTKAGLTAEAAAFLVAMYGAFSASNVATTLSALRGTPSSAPGTDLTPVTLRLEAIEAAVGNPEALEALQGTLARLDAIQEGVQLQNQALASLMANAKRPPQQQG